LAIIEDMSVTIPTIMMLAALKGGLNSTRCKREPERGMEPSKIPSSILAAALGDRPRSPQMELRMSSLSMPQMILRIFF
jgi:hypothetical protein